MSVNCVRNLLEYASTNSSEKTAVVYGNKSLTYGELLKKVNRLANYFTKLNYPKGTRIGIYSNKSIEQVLAILSLLSTEYVFVPITRLLKPEQVKYIVDDCDIKCIVTESNKLETIKESGFSGKIVTYKTNKELDSFEEIYKYYDDKFTPTVKSFHNATIIYSFSSSGLPKGVVITHRSLVDGARIVTKYLRLNSNDVISGVLSFNLDYGINQIIVSIYNLATLALHKIVLAGDFFNHLLNDKVTVLPVMPIHITQMFDDEPHRLPTPDELKNVRIITSSGGKITTKMLQDIEKFFSYAKFYSMHGLSEAFRSAYLDPSQLKIRPTSIGKAVPDVELYVINKEGYECKPREIGELIHRGACIYKGYWNSPKDTKIRFKSIKILEKVIDLEGELTDEIVVASGDYVFKDEEGYIYFHSRKDDMIKTRGYRVSPHEIERAVYDNLEKVSSCAVFGIEDEKIEEAIVLVYTAPKEIVKNELLFELKKHLPSYMLPSYIVYKKSIPLHYGKINKAILKEEFVNHPTDKQV
jgi:acyl-CoA synthetase (AMP-forming)/AMP-acid ligase II